MTSVLLQLELPFATSCFCYFVWYILKAQYCTSYRFLRGHTGVFIKVDVDVLTFLFLYWPLLIPSWHQTEYHLQVSIIEGYGLIIIIMV